MPSITLILQALIALLKFPREMGAFIKLMSDSPEEKRAKIEAQVNAWTKESSESERPSWEG